MMSIIDKECINNNISKGRWLVLLATAVSLETIGFRLISNKNVKCCIEMVACNTEIN